MEIGTATATATRPLIVVLTESEIRQCATLDDAALAAVAQAFSSLAAGDAFVPPIMGILVPEQQGEVDVKSAYIKGLPAFAIKVASGFFSNPQRGLPTSSGLMLVMSAETGYPLAVLLDNGYLTNVRTGLAGAIASKYLAPSTVETVGVVGAGAQGRYQARALQLVRRFRRVLVYDRDSVAVDQYVAEMPGVLGVAVQGAADVRTVVEQSQVVITSTPSHEPYLRPEWLHPGLHIASMGADLPEKQELFAETVGRVDVIACDLKAQCFARGELHHALLEGAISEHDEKITELGALTSGNAPGRANDSQMTLSVLTGVGVQDTAIALFTWERARQLGFGREV
jgi:ectoine utilization protein EutC